jgi:cystathionine beta-lyase/cystathionine gamma-synthase
MKFATRAIHVGQEPDPSTGAIIPPIYQTSTYVQEELGKNKGHVYARVSNPTRAGLEACLASLEGGRFGLAFASGSAATHAVLSLLVSGDHVVVGDDVYGGTYRLFEQVLRNYGYEFTYVDTRNLDAVRAAIKENTKMLWLESPTNPLLHLADIAALCKLAADSSKSDSKSERILSVVDNTFASPALQLPLSMGADIVVHSTTKYLGGHSDVIGGAVVINEESLNDRLKFIQKSIGAVPGPMDCYLVMRGIKTLAIRMRAHNENALRLAKHFENHAALEKVIYPGLSSHPQHELAKKQMSGCGGMVSLVVRGGLENAKLLLKNTHLFALAESLGGVESLIGHPATMTHAAMPKAERDARGVVDGLVRLSVGIEDADDLIEDLESALSKVLCQDSVIA